MASHRWAIILCRFADVPGEPNPPQFYRDVLTEAGAGTGGVFDYWLDVSYGAIDMTGSRVFGWFDTAKTAADYAPLIFPGDRSQLAQWGRDAAAANGVDVSTYDYFTVVFNRGTDSGFSPAGLVLGVGVWNTSFACHEIGHHYGLAHSWRASPDTVYGDPYDVMSLFTNYFPFPGTYGESGPGLVAPQLDAIGVLPPGRVNARSSPTADRVTLAALNVPAAAGPLAVRFVVDPARPCQHQTMLEFRRKQGWDRGLPEDAVVVHEIRDGLSYLLTGNTGRGLVTNAELITFDPEIHVKVEAMDLVANTATVRYWSLDDGDLRVEDGSADTYLIWGGAKWLVSQTQLVDLGYSSQQIGLVPSGALSALPAIPRDHTWLVEFGNQGLNQRPVYVVQHGLKRRLYTPLSDAFARFRFDPSDLGVVPPGALAHIPDGPPLNQTSKLTSLPPAHVSNTVSNSSFVVWRPSNQHWYIKLDSTSATVADARGQSGDIPLLGDFNGDGADEFSLWRPSTGQWLTGLGTTQWGEASDFPVPEDYDGDERCDFATFRPYEANWYLKSSATGRARIIQFGEPGDLPVPADYDGDGKCDLAVWRPRVATWFVRRSETCGVWSVVLGEPSDIPVPADYDGDGIAELALFRPRDGTWNLRSPSGATRVIQWGRAGDIPVPGDFDGDGLADIAVWRPADGNWWVLLSSRGYDRNAPLIVQLGQGGDVPVLGFPWLATRAGG